MKQAIPLPPKKTINKYLRYNSKTGIFRWKIDHGSAKKDRIAGVPNSVGRLQISIDGRKYQAHRIAYFLKTGDQPPEVDHKNGIPTDNRISNLRPANRSLNARNMKKRVDNTSGVTGVVKMQRDNMWRATFGSQEFMKHYKTCKYFNNFNDAVQQRKEWEDEFGMTELKKHRRANEL